MRARSYVRKSVSNGEGNTGLWRTNSHCRLIKTEVYERIRKWNDKNDRFVDQSHESALCVRALLCRSTAHTLRCIRRNYMARVTQWFSQFLFIPVQYPLPGASSCQLLQTERPSLLLSPLIVCRVGSQKLYCASGGSILFLNFHFSFFFFFFFDSRSPWLPFPSGVHGGQVVRWIPFQRLLLFLCL